MAAKEPLVIDLFDGEYHGAWTGEVVDGETGKKPKIRKIAKGFVSSLLPWVKSSAEFPYEIDMKKNVVNGTTRQGDQIKFLVPTEDVRNCNLENTLYADIAETRDEQMENLNEEVKRLKRRNRTLEKENSRLREEQEEQEKRKKSSGGSSGLKCDRCSQSHARSEYRNNNGRCPNCGKPHKSFKSNGSSSVK